jgi:hypothetical protein
MDRLPIKNHYHELSHNTGTGCFFDRRFGELVEDSGEGH